ncbi:MAG: cob(I)yrinic acid a,c-diamide adenosyltransferase [Erysipelotrichia bacterium]|nr:cob(I)yrinic acid a,c-diamide adenosyltransferase [Candidatus Riflebacteria bacterium]NCB38662.1 cob(I)yrinic acid a,c-diamide adenosyltransferase [Erysipelotrichia bacterium]
MIQAYIGDGKGKTTAATGLLIRAFGAGRRVGAVLFDKGSETYRHNELAVFAQLGIEFYITGLERMKPDGTFRFGVTPQDIEEAVRGLSLAENLMAGGNFDLLVLDEILSSMTYGLLTREAVLGLIQRAPKDMELILTGRCEDEQLLDHADLVTRMVKERHYFDRGVKARAGIEY